jgi:hypothetical protein
MRLKASLAGVEGEFQEGHELNAKTAKKLGYRPTCFVAASNPIRETLDGRTRREHSFAERKQSFAQCAQEPFCAACDVVAAQITAYGVHSRLRVGGLSSFMLGRPVAPGTHEI